MREEWGKALAASVADGSRCGNGGKQMMRRLQFAFVFVVASSLLAQGMPPARAMSTLQTQTFGYDEYGNLINTSKLGQTVLLPITPGTNQLQALHYDSSGNVDIAGSQHYDYDAVGMPNTVRLGTSIQPCIIYAYTADDERLFSFDVSTGITHWTLRGFDNKVLRDFKQSGSTWSVERDYIYRDGLLLAALKPTGVEHYTLDHLGTPRLITDGQGHRIGYHVYWPFGEEWTSGGAQEGSPLKFTAHERDADPTGGTAPLDYMHARYYGGTWGRFSSADPSLDLKKTIGNPQMWNRYAYVVNNPIRYTDPDGREHVNEPGFTRSLSEANDWDEQPSVSRAFNAQGALLSLAADEFVIGPVVGRAFSAVGRFVGAISEEIGLSRSIMTALKSTNAATRLEGEAAAALSKSVTSFQRVVKGVGEVDVETAKAIVEVTGGRSPGKLAQITKLVTDRRSIPVVSRL
ncbi:MAG TPA: RHS repeat-associated core domain-containing protein [Thermoanaerobaculia bacterium]|jgi:RHS repeat-associated protein|nr:RHS repeat-associated core domain-containing protein [Thermoanaerobaculia bacterium]